MGDWLVRHVTIFGIHGQNWMLITFAGWDFRAIAHGELRSPSVTSLLFWHVNPSNQSLDP
jgi:hypothetical protein